MRLIRWRIWFWTKFRWIVQLKLTKVQVKKIEKIMFEQNLKNLFENLYLNWILKQLNNIQGKSTQNRILKNLISSKI